MADDAVPRPALPITVIGGYLGAGKTTLLNSVLRQAAGRRVGVVVNDFGELGIDAERIAGAVPDEHPAGADTRAAPAAEVEGRGPDARDVEVVNLPNGCVCCTLGDDLMRTLAALADQRPWLDDVVVEASGVADPAATAAWGTVPPFVPGGVIVLVAADTLGARLRDRYVGTEVRRQIEAADLVVLTKTDLVGVGRVAEARSTIGALSDAPVVEVVAGDVDVELVLGPRSGTGSSPSHRPGAGDVADGRSLDHRDTSDDHAERYVRWSFVDDRAVELTALHTALRSLPTGLLRLKGEVGLVRDDRTASVNVVGGTVDVTLRSGAATGVRLEAIGLAAELDPDALDALALRMR